MGSSSGRVLVLMGPAGSGKSTVGNAAATLAGVHFFEGDDFHPPENVAKIAAGSGLTNEDRKPWIAAIGDAWRAVGRPDALLACSALNEEVRDMLRQEFGERMRPVLLDVPAEELIRRLEQREGHFAGPDLIASQFAAMDDCRGVSRVDGQLPAAELAPVVAAHFDSDED